MTQSHTPDTSSKSSLAFSIDKIMEKPSTTTPSQSPSSARRSSPALGSPRSSRHTLPRPENAAQPKPVVPVFPIPTHPGAAAAAVHYLQLGLMSEAQRRQALQHLPPHHHHQHKELDAGPKVMGPWLHPAFLMAGRMNDYHAQLLRHYPAAGYMAAAGAFSNPREQQQQQHPAHVQEALRMAYRAAAATQQPKLSPIGHPHIHPFAPRVQLPRPEHPLPSAALANTPGATSPGRHVTKLTNLPSPNKNANNPDLPSTLDLSMKATPRSPTTAADSYTSQHPADHIAAAEHINVEAAAEDMDDLEEDEEDDDDDDEDISVDDSHPYNPDNLDTSSAADLLNTSITSTTSSSPPSPPSPSGAASSPGIKMGGGQQQQGQKTFTCPECGKVFNAHYNLTRHMPVHTGARPFVCKICGKGFRQASTLCR